MMTTCTYRNFYKKIKRAQSLARAVVEGNVAEKETENQEDDEEKYII